MPLGEIPIWGQWGVLGLSIGLNMYFIVQYIRGQLVSHLQLEDAQKAAESWRLAWVTSQETNHAAATLLNQLTITSQTMERVLNALPASHGTGATPAPNPGWRAP